MKKFRLLILLVLLTTFSCGVKKDLVSHFKYRIDKVEQGTTHFTNSIKRFDGCIQFISEWEFRNNNYKDVITMCENYKITKINKNK